jgi:uncharacterized phage protein (TIGR01671 family)
MNREILFKAKRIDNGEWIEGYYLKYGYIGQEKPYIMPSYASALYAFEVDPATVGQFTGLTDKNGKKIFEGDVVHCYGGEYYQGYWEHDVILKITNENFYDSIFILGETENIIVIGNIHDTEGTK